MMPKLPMLKPRLKEVDLLPRGIKMVKYPSKPTQRVSKTDNGRTLPLTSAAWRKLRRSVLSSEPLCRMCTSQGKTVTATDVDHRDNDPSNNDLVNLQPLCHECHSRKTQRDMGNNVAMGCATDGTPLDPYHHWNEGVRADVVRSAAAVSEKSPATQRHKPTVYPSFNANCKTVA